LKVVWSGPAERDLRRLDRPVQQRVARAIDRLARTAVGDVTALRGSDGGLPLRVGDWRVRFEVIEDALYVPHVRHRREAYR